MALDVLIMLAATYLATVIGVALSDAGAGVILALALGFVLVAAYPVGLAIGQAAPGDEYRREV